MHGKFFEFKFRDQIWPQIRIQHFLSNSKLFPVEFEIRPSLHVGIVESERGVTVLKTTDITRGYLRSNAAVPLRLI